MGNLLRLISRDVDSCCSVPKYDIFVDFENAQPQTELEYSLYEEAERVLEKSVFVLKELENYQGTNTFPFPQGHCANTNSYSFVGASLEIREAITKPTKVSEENAWKAVLPMVEKLESFYEFSKELTTILPKILHMLSCPVKENELTSQPVK